MSIENIRTLLSGFGGSIGLPGLVPDDDGYAALSFDDLPVHLQFDAEADELVAFSRIGEIDADRRETIYAWLLGANLFWQATKGATLAAEPASDAVFIQHRFDGARADQAAFEAWLAAFVDSAAYWQSRLAAANAGEPLEADAGSDAGDGGDGAVTFRA